MGNPRECIVVAHLLRPDTPTDIYPPAEWMKGNRRQCEAKAIVWSKYYHHVEVSGLARLD